MADFLQAYDRMIVNEGGYRMTVTPGDRGGTTYAGISRRNWPGWPGWESIDRGEPPHAALVRQFYRDHFWDACRLDEVLDQSVARTIFDFAVNAGVQTAGKLAQLVVGATPDGRIGPVTLTAINAADPGLFAARYALAKLARYRDIVARDRTQAKFLLGWINRLLREAS